MTSIATASGDQPMRVICAARLHAADAAALWESLEPLFAAPPEVLAVDASAVQRIDAAAIQVFAVLARELHMAGCKVRWENCSDQWNGAVGLLGMTEMCDTAP